MTTPITRHTEPELKDFLDTHNQKVIIFTTALSIDLAGLTLTPPIRGVIIVNGLKQGGFLRYESEYDKHRTAWIQ